MGSGVKGRKIDLTEYKAKKGIACSACGNRMRDAEGDELHPPVQPKGVLGDLSCHPATKLAGKALRDAFKMADRFEECEEDHIILSSNEWDSLKKTIDKIPGLHRCMDEILNRVFHAEEVNMKEEEK